MKKDYPRFQTFLAVFATIGMFPSFIALSQSLYAHWPAIGTYLGPINPLKLTSVFFFIWVYLRRSEFSQSTQKMLIAALVVGSLGTITGGLGCGGFPPGQLREWFAMVLGVTVALSIMTLKRELFVGVLFGWLAIVYGSVALNYVFPSGLNWINAHLFDPARQVPLHGESPQFLMGFFDIVSLGKLLIWMPWVAGLALVLKWPKHARLNQGILLALIAVSTGLSLATTQRGPIVGMIGGTIFFFAHRWWVTRNNRVLVGALVMMLMTGAAILAIVPKKMIEQRVTPLFSTDVKFDGTGVEAGGSPTVAHASVLQRKRLVELAVSEISKHPLGHVCTNPEEFKKRGIIEAYHTHNLFLEQFKSRGWLWGLFHLLLWGLALLQSWRLRGWVGSVLVGGVGTTCVMGLSDHPWFVLNHAMILGVFLFAWITPVITPSVQD